MLPDDVRVVLLDIEGTTTPIDFVYLTLFPFARRHLRGFLQTYSETNLVGDDVLALKTEQQRDRTDGLNPPDWTDDEFESAARYAEWLMDLDRKSTALKSLQGKIWEEGYQSGELQGIVYPDVPLAFTRWREGGRRIAIYSSGSILAQKLIFGHSNAGDLTTSINAYFDTTTGGKREAGSYTRIAAALTVSTREVMFISDVSAELDAARAAGMQTRLCVRDNPTHPTHSEQSVITTFSDI